MKLNIYI